MAQNNEYGQISSDHMIQGLVPCGKYSGVAEGIMLTISYAILLYNFYKP